MEHNQSNSTSLPACFAFVLKSPIPVCAGVLKGVQKVTGLSPDCFVLKRSGGGGGGGAKSSQAAGVRKPADDGAKADAAGDDYEGQEEEVLTPRPFFNLLVDTASGGKIDVRDGAGARTPLFVVSGLGSQCCRPRGLIGLWTRRWKNF